MKNIIQRVVVWFLQKMIDFMLGILYRMRAYMLRNRRKRNLTPMERSHLYSVEYAIDTLELIGARD